MVKMLWLLLLASCIGTGTPGFSQNNEETNEFLSGKRGFDVHPTTIENVLTETLDALDGIASHHFTIYHEGNPAYAKEISLNLERAYRRFHNQFTGFYETLDTPPPLIWICFRHRDSFEDYAQAVEGFNPFWLDSYYSTRTNRVVLMQSNGAHPPDTNLEMTPGIAEEMPPSQSVLPLPMETERYGFARITHELAHQLAYNCGLQKRGVMYPFWLSEGLATGFEFSDPADTELGIHSNARLQCLLESHATGELIPLDTFLVQTQGPTDPESSRRYYAQAWALFQFIWHKKPNNLNHYLHSLAQLSPGRRDRHRLLVEFTSSFGSLPPFQRSWMHYLDHLSSTSMRQ